MAEIFVDTKQVKSLSVELGALAKKAPKEILVPALNHTVAKVNTAVKRETAGLYVIPQKDMSKDMKVVKASTKRPAAGVIIRGKPKGLIHFKLKPSKMQSQKGKKVNKRKSLSVMIKKGGGYKQIGIKPAAFVTRANGTLNVFHRAGKKSLPIERLVTLSVPQMVSSKAVINPVQKMAQEHLNKRIKHELERALKKLKGGKK